MKRFALAVLLALLLAVDYFAAQYYCPVTKLEMNTQKG